MAAQISYTGDVPSRSHDLLLVVGATVLSLALATALGAWLVVHQGADGSAGGTVRGGHARAVTTSARGVSRASTGADTPNTGDKQHGRVATAVPAPAARTLYLVSTAEQAAVVAEAIEEANAIRDAMGISPLDERVLVFASNEEAALFWLTRGDEAAVCGAPCDALSRVIDLRGGHR